ncbi:MAG: hypothetical protein PHS41_02265 [Victivallaceae bacterium]|nr:hypothetical protein [Victivallaceae bacterium]
MKTLCNPMRTFALSMLGVVIAASLGCVAAAAEYPLFQNAPCRTHLGLGKEFPGAQGSLSELREAGRTIQSVDYNLAKGAYVELIYGTSLPEGSKGLSFEVQASSEPLGLFIRTRDAAGRVRQQYLTVQKCREKFVKVDVDLARTEGSWGPGSEKDPIRWPLRQFSIGIRRRAEATGGNAKFTNFRLTGDFPATELKKFTVRAEPVRLGGLFLPEERPGICLNVESLWLHALPKFEIGYTVYDWLGKEVFSGKESRPASGKIALAWAPEQFQDRFGAFRVALEIALSTAPGKKISVTTWLGRLTSPPPPPNQFIGVNTHFWKDYRPDQVEILRQIGIGMVRDGFGPPPRDKKTGAYLFNPRYDTLVDLLQRAGIRKNLILLESIKAGKTLDMENFLGYVEASAKRYRGKIAVYEIWNEPGHFFFAKHYGSRETAAGIPLWLEKYLELNRKCIAILRKNDPQAKIAVGVEDSWSRLRQMIEAGIGKSNGTSGRPDIVSFHPYCHAAPQPERIAILQAQTKELVELCRKYDAPQRLMISESGWTTYTRGGRYHQNFGSFPGVDYPEQATYLIRLYLIGKASKVASVMVYDLRNDGPNREYTEDNFGLLHEDFTPKPSALAIAYFARTVGAMNYLRDLSEEPSEYHAYAFGQGENFVIAAHTVTGTRRISLAVDGSYGIVADLQGNRKKIPAEKGRIQWEASESVHYLLNPAKIGLRDGIVLDGLPDPLTPVLGEELHIPFQVQTLRERPSSTGKATVCISTPDGSFSRTVSTTLQGKEQRGKSQAAEEVVFPFGKEWQKYVGLLLRCQITWEQDGQKETRILRGKLYPPLEIDCSDIFYTRGKRAAGCNVHLRGKQTRQIRLEAPKEKFATQRLLPPGTHKIDIPVSDAAQSLAIESMLPPNWRESKVFRLRDAVIPCMDRRPAFDGDMGKYKALLSLDRTAIARKYHALGAAKTKIDRKDLDYEVKLGHCPAGLLIAVDVTDNRHCQRATDGKKLWAGDSLQLALSREDGTHVVEFAVGAVSNGRAFCEIALAPAMAKVEKIEAAAKFRSDGVVYEILIPWSATSFLQREPGTRFRFSILANDNDGDGRKGYLEHHGGIGQEKTSGAFGLYSLGAL